MEGKEFQTHFEPLRPYAKCSDVAFEKVFDLLDVPDKLDYGLMQAKLSILFCSIFILFNLIWAGIIIKSPMYFLAFVPAEPK